MDYLKHYGKQKTANQSLLEAKIAANITDWKISAKLHKVCDLYCLTNTPWWHCRTFRQSRHWTQQSQPSPTSTTEPPYNVLPVSFPYYRPLLSSSEFVLASLQNFEKRLLGSTGPSVRPSAWKNSALTGRIFIKFGIFEYFSNNCQENSSYIKIW